MDPMARTAASGSPERSFQMNVAIPPGERRQPVYLLLDCSGSMKGPYIQAVKHGVEVFKGEVMRQPEARETVYVCIITFHDKAQMVTAGLEAIESFVPPEIDAGGETNLCSALRLLSTSLDKDVRQPRTGGPIADWKPIVFLLTDGEPTEKVTPSGSIRPEWDWRAARRDILNRITGKLADFITVGCGPGISADNLRSISMGSTYLMADDSSASFSKFFNYVSQSIAFVAHRNSVQQGNQSTDRPPPPNGDFGWFQIDPAP